MTESPRTPTGSAVPDADALRERRGRWRAGASSSPRPATQRVAAGAGLALAALAALVLSTALVVAPLFSWQTAGVALVVDGQTADVLSPVPFARQDMTALAASLSGRLSPALSPDLLPLKDFDTVEAMRDRLHGFFVKMPLRAKDTMIAYVRGQCLVPPPLLDADGNERPDPLGGHACLVATDATLRGEGLRELVPIRDIVESIGSAASLTTLVAIDLGNLRWDPRIGVLCGLVPRQMDRDFEGPPIRANGQNWVIASHDTLQYSGADAAGKRTFFAVALEQGLAGAADQAPWGDGDRVVELHELAPFVVVWTSEWSRRSSGGRAPQRPVVWKLGAGRVDLRDIPKNIRLVRVSPTAGTGALSTLRRLMPLGAPAKQPPSSAPPSAPLSPSKTSTAEVPSASATISKGAAGEDATRGSPTSASTAPAPPSPAPPSPAPATTATAPSAPPATVEAPSPQPASPMAPGQPPAAGMPPAESAVAGASGEPAPAAQSPSSPAALQSAAPLQSRSDDPWELLKSLTSRTTPPPASEPRPSVIDYAPHVWRQAASFVAATTTDAGLEGPAAERARAALQRFSTALAGIDDTTPNSLARLAASPPAEALAAARRASNAAGLPETWSSAPKPLLAAIAARNDAVELGWSMLDVVGRLSGGAGPLFVEPGLIDGFIARIARLSDAIATASTISPAESDTARLDPLTTATQNMLSQSLLMRSLQDQLLASLTAEAGSTARIPLNDRIILLRSRLPDASQRASLLPVVPSAADGDLEAADGKGTTGTEMKAAGRPPLPPAGPRTIDRAGWRNCASLAAAVIDLIDASGINATIGSERTPTTLQPTLDDIAAARRAIAQLENASGDEDAAREAAAKLSARLTRLFERAALTAYRLSDTDKGRAAVVDADRFGGLLRIIDPRDAAVVGDRMTAGVNSRSAAPRYGLRIQFPDSPPPRLGIATDIQISLADAANVPAASGLTLGFDPAHLALRLPDGTILNEGVSVPLHDLPWRGGSLALQAVPLQRANAGVHASVTQLTALLTTDDYVEKAACSLPLPSERSVFVAVRGDIGSIAGIAGEDGWVRASRGSQVVRDVALAEATTFQLSLNGSSGRVMAWELGLEAVAGAVSVVDVELHSIPATSSPDGRQQAWSEAETALLAGKAPAKPLARAAGVKLDRGGQIVPLVFPIEEGKTLPQKPGEQAARQPPAAGETGALELPPPSSQAVGSADRQIGPDLAIVVRDPLAPAGERPMITRISLEARHPRDLISPVARYDDRARTITVSLEPLGGDSSRLPPDGTRVTLREPDGESAPGGSLQAAGVSAFVPRKTGAILTAASPRSDVIASWNGPDQATARFSLDVDGYPRAFNFAVECSSAAHLRPQGPQHDWRQIRIIAPAEAQTLLKAPVTAVPMRLAVDAPADTFLGGATIGGSVAIVLRQIGAGLGDRGEERTVWRASHARQVSFTLEPPKAGTSLAIKTVVDDWTVPASGEGFANVDVTAEARLVIAGLPSAVVDSRVLVFDAQAPVVNVPPSVRATVGKPLVVPIQVADDSSDGYLIPPERRRPGVSGLKSVEWAIDTEGKGQPKEWQPAVWIGGTNYEVRIDSKKLPFGVRLPVLVRATDAVGLSDPPARIWLDVGSEAASTLNSLTGKVVLSGRGEPDLPVVLTGPGGDRTTKTRPGGVFRFDDLEPGEYKISVQAAVRNRMRKAEPAPVTIEAAPAPAASVTLELK